MRNAPSKLINLICLWLVARFYMARCRQSLPEIRKAALSLFIGIFRFCACVASSKRRCSSLMLAVILLATTIAPPLAIAKTTTKIPSPAMPKTKVKRGTKTPTLFTTKFSLSPAPNDSEISRTRAFSAPLAPMHRPAVAGENQALSSALTAFKKKNSVDDVTDLTQFINAYPKSRWTPSLKLSAGELLYSNGYYSLAYDNWKSVWEARKDETGREQKAVADRAIAYLLQLEARLG